MEAQNQGTTSTPGVTKCTKFFLMKGAPLCSRHELCDYLGCVPSETTNWFEANDQDTDHSQQMYRPLFARLTPCLSRGKRSSFVLKMPKN